MRDRHPPTDVLRNPLVSLLMAPTAAQPDQETAATHLHRVEVEIERNGPLGEGVDELVDEHVAESEPGENLDLIWFSNRESVG